MIGTSYALAIALLEKEDTYITISIGKKEYAIQGIKSAKTHANIDDSTTHLTILCNGCEVGNIVKVNNIEENINTEDKQILLKLICNEQTHMLVKDNTKYELDEYKRLEELKVKIKEM